MSGRSRGIMMVGKKACYRTIVVDAGRNCGNGCDYCFDNKWAPIREATYDKCGGETPLTIDRVRKQLDGNTILKRRIDSDRVVRIGALCDIKKDDTDTYEKTRSLMQLLWGKGYKYMLITKSCHSIDNDMLKDIKRHDGLLSVSLGYNRDSSARLFEDVATVPVEGRKDLLRRAMDMGIKNTLRLNPIHPNYIDEAMRVLNWYKSIGGERVILEILRISAGWQKKMPRVNFDSYVSYKKGGVYSGYLTPPREMTELVYNMVINYGKSIGMNKITICADKISNDKYGYNHGVMDCCHTTEMWPVPLPDIEV